MMWLLFEFYLSTDIDNIKLQELGGDHVGDRHLFGGLVGGVAVHDALVTGTALIELYKETISLIYREGI